MADDLSTQEFETVKGENGEVLVKVMFSGENGESAGMVYVSPRIAKRILSGEITPTVDEDGKTVLTYDEPLQEGDSQNPDDDKLDTDVQYTLSEETGLVDGQQVRMVTLLNAAGEILDQKHGDTDETIVMEIGGQSFQYQIQGPSLDNEPITSTFVISEEQQPSEHFDEDIKPKLLEIGSPQQETEVDTEEGKKYVLIEETSISMGRPTQIVYLQNAKGEIVDRKKGMQGDTVQIDLEGHSVLDYVFLGPTDDGQPSKTTIMVTSELEAADTETEAGK
ncbi:Leucine-rich repeats and WD repeat domain-containing protein 1 [Cichlidogyrus casuarinus]|uniref:Leucine-rich repeats and WD repeat domain-containing protein 1 n=1 Tax=Cichlidogyrus casuarinus TaxID=1844966 RepID=A0ABD2Q331_9PLAT